jgi:hypothetical protein
MAPAKVVIHHLDVSLITHYNKGCTVDNKLPSSPELDILAKNDSYKKINVSEEKFWSGYRVVTNTVHKHHSQTLFANIAWSVLTLMKAVSTSEIR